MRITPYCALSIRRTIDTRHGSPRAHLGHRAVKRRSSGGSATNATDRLAHVPASQTLLARAAERGSNLGAITSALIRLLDRNSAADLQAVILEALERDVPHPNAVRLALEAPQVGVIVESVPKRTLRIVPEPCRGFWDSNEFIRRGSWTDSRLISLRETPESTTGTVPGHFDKLLVYHRNSLSVRFGTSSLLTPSCRQPAGCGSGAAVAGGVTGAGATKTHRGGPMSFIRR